MKVLDINIIKNNGNLEKFNEEKIKNKIKSLYDKNETYSENYLDILIKNIKNALLKTKFKGNITQNVLEDLIEIEIMKTLHSKLAKNYILSRIKDI